MSRFLALILSTLVTLLAACGGSGGDSSPVVPEPRPAGLAVLGSAGGKVLGVDGASVEVPADALRADATVSIARDDTGAPPLPSSFVPASSTFAVTPHGQNFRQPVTVRIPYDATALRSDQRPAVMKGMPGRRWQLLLDAVDEGGTVAVQVQSLSYFVVVPVPRTGFFLPQPPAVPDPTAAVVTAQLQNAWTTLPLTGNGARLVLQQAADDPAQVRVTVRIGSQSALAQSCRGDLSVASEITSAVIYRLPSDGAAGGVNRVATDPASSRNTRLSAYVPDSTAWLTWGDVATPIARDTGYSSLETVNAAFSQWNPPDPDPWTGVPTTDLPSSAVVDAWATMQRLALFCSEGWNGWEIPIPVQPLLVARGFPIDDILVTAQPPSRLDRLAGQLVNLPAAWVSPVPSFAVWQQRVRGASLWAAVPPPQYVDLNFPPGVWQLDTGALYGAARAADDGTSYRLRVCASSGLPVRCVYSRETQLRVSSNFPPPVFTTQPVGRVYNVGQTVDMVAAYRGLPLPERVVWQTRSADSEPWVEVGAGFRSGSPRIIDAGDETAVDRLTGLQPLTLADRGRQFRATYTTVAGTATSDVVTLQVTTGQAPPVFTAQPAAATVGSGSAVLFATAVGGAQPMSYQWTFNGVRIPGANGPLLTLNSVNAANAGVYQLEASNVEATVLSTAARLTVTQGANTGTPPLITGQPASLTVPAGASASFAVSAGAGALAYQWQRDGTNIAGATAAVYTLTNVSEADRGAYAVVVSNTSGVASSQVALLNVTAGSALAAPAITTAPVGLSVQLGQPALLAVGASGSGPLAYRWQRNGVDVVGASSPVLRIASAQAGDAGDYTVTVSNGVGSMTSAAAGLVVTPAPGAPTITAPLGNLSVPEGQRATFSLAVAGNPAPQCQWTRNGVALPGAISCTGYTTPDTTSADNGALYNVVVYSPGGVVFGNGAVLTVTPAPAVPVITQDLADVTALEGGTATFSVVATANGPLFHYWTRIGAPTTPLGGSSFDIGPLQASDDGATVRVIVCNGPIADNRCTTSRDARLTVTPAVPANALTATQIVAGYEWSMVLRPDRSVWAWGGPNRGDGVVQTSGNMLDANRAVRPVRMYPAALSDVRAISGWNNSFWALKGEPGSAGSRVLHWGRAVAGNDGRGGDGNGSLGSSIATRDNEATPVEVLERVNGVPRPVDRVCAISGGGEQLAMIRAINSAGTTTDCNAGSAKTVWYVGSLLGRGYESTGIAFAMPGLPTDSPPAVIFTGKTTSGSPPLVIALEDGRVYGLGANPYGGLGLAATGSGQAGDLSGPLLLPNTWGHARSFGMSFYYSLFALRSDGSVMTSGYDGNGELGLGSVIGGSTLGPLPVKAESCSALPCADVLTGVTAITGTTAQVTLALKNGQILAWGAGNSAGLRGPGATTNQPFPRSVPSTVAGFTALSASNGHALVIGPGNVVYAWGSNLRYALGDTDDRTTPTMVTVP